MRTHIKSVLLLVEAVSIHECPHPRGFILLYGSVGFTEVYR